MLLIFVVTVSPFITTALFFSIFVCKKSQFLYKITITVTIHVLVILSVVVLMRTPVMSSHVYRGREAGSERGRCVVWFHSSSCLCLVDRLLHPNLGQQSFVTATSASIHVQHYVIVQINSYHPHHHSHHHISHNHSHYPCCQDGGPDQLQRGRAHIQLFSIKTVHTHSCHTQ